MQIKDVNAVITGGASGLGEATTRSLVSMGAKVAIFDIAVERGEKLAAELGRNCLYANADVTNDEASRAGIARTMAAFGKINLAVNCAGVADPGKILSKKGPLSLELFNRVVQINLVGTLNIIRLAVEQMVKNEPNEEGEKGVIVNTSSAAAFDGQVGQAAYAASKAGVVGMTLPIARECADYGIRVMTIAPGLFDTPMMAGLPESVRVGLAQTVPFPKRLGKPSEFALLVRQIIENPMLNGECIRLDGSVRMAAK
ncbi:MAG: 3-hydroxyacyl-CoA dehydrogenase [Deltaproteobacteria bacterium]|nr:3-hydroxyacyl-CoA dehydrogenase [Deltaproteobacteria bacterium]